MAAPLLSVRGLGKSYGGVSVLRGVSIDLHRGEVHAIVGENGAGKSTLSRIVAGLTRADAGTMHLDGAPYAPRSRAEAERGGVAIVTQELALLPTLTIGESVFFDRLPSRFGVVDRPRLAVQSREALSRVGLEGIDTTRLVGTLRLAERQLVEIAAALARSASVLILDEPTSALSPREAAALFVQVDRLRAEGRAIIFVSHRLGEVERLADRVTVLRDGSVVTTREAPGLAPDEIVRLMVGRDVTAAARRRGAPSQEVALKATGLTGHGFRDVSLEVRRGEILGLAGLMGAGRTEVLRALFGADATTAGAVHLDGSSAPATIRSPRDAVARGMALLTEDRKTEGLLLPLSARTNTTLARLADLAGGLGVVDRGREDQAAVRLGDAVGLRCRSMDQPVEQLSGGNQQKVLLARWLHREPRVLLVDEPTRGIDVGSRAEIHRLLASLADRGTAVVVASSDLEELLAICDRIVVLSAGRVTRALDRDAFAAGAVMAAALEGLGPGAVA